MRITKLPKWLRLPSPVELGRSDHNALPMRDLGCQPGDYTWEDWEEEVSTKYPIKYFLLETLHMWWKVHIYMPIDNAIYWVKCKLFKSYKFHLVDIRNYEYKWGYLDPCEQMLYSVFAVLDRYVKVSKLEKKLEWHIEELNKGNDVEYFKDRVQVLESILRIHNWWHIERPRLQKEMNDESMVQYKKSHGERDYSKYREIEERIRNEEKEAIKTLADVREYMWD